VGPQQGRKVFTLQTLPDESDSLSSNPAAEAAGFSLHAGVATKPMSVPYWSVCAVISQDRRYPPNACRVRAMVKCAMSVKTPWRNGTAHGIDFTTVGTEVRVAKIISHN